MFEGLIRAKSLIEAANLGGEPLSRVPLLLNRGLRVTASSHSFSQRLVSMRPPGMGDLELTVNLVEVELEEPLEPGGRCRVLLEYEGEIRRYEHVFPYIRDKVSVDYSLVRPDAFSYPVPSLPDYSVLVSTLPRQRFSYRIKARVPRGYRAAALGRLIETRDLGEWVEYHYESKASSWRIDLAVARFSVTRDDTLDLTVYALPGDEAHTERILGEIPRALALYKRLLGDPPAWMGYTVIEIPDGWGGQADVAGALIPASDFRSLSGIATLYHELAHLWSVPSTEDPPSRLLDEGIASYLQLVAEEELMGRSIADRLERARDRLRDMARRQGDLLKAPISDYGRYGLTDASYIVGAWILHILGATHGDCIWRALGSLVSEHTRKPASLEDFARHIGAACGREAGELAKRLLFTSESTRLLVSDWSLEEILERIRSFITRHSGVP